MRLPPNPPPVRPLKKMTAITLRVKVKPNARSSSLEQLPDGTWLARLKSPPVDGKANKELVALVSSHFHCRQEAVVVRAGAAGRMKVLRVESA
jgi:hypothetical protein